MKAIFVFLVVLFFATIISGTSAASRTPIRDSAQLVSPISKVGSNIECSLCQLLANVAEQWMSENKTSSWILTEAEKVCDIAPKQYKATCDAIVDTYLPMMLQMLETMSPDQVCQKVHLCPNNGTAPLSVFDVELFASLSRLSNVKGDAPCSICEIVASIATQYIDSNATEEETVEFCEKACQLLPSHLVGVCVAIVDQYVPVFFQMASQMDPQQLCQYVHLCPSVSTLPKGDTTCTFCKLAVTLIDYVLAQNSSQQEILDELDSICAMLGGSIAQECDTLVQMFGPELIQALEGYSPDEVCSLIDLCPSQVQVVDDSGKYCKVCEMIAAYVEDWVQANNSISDLENYLDDLCHALPKHDSTLCQAMVNQYLPQIIAWAVQKEPPQSLCEFIHVCSSVEGKAVCTACELAVTEIQHIIGSVNATAIEAALDGVCSFLPGKYEQMCVDVMNAYVPQLLAYIQDASPQTLCQDLKLCHSVQLKKIISSR